MNRAKRTLEEIIERLEETVRLHGEELSQGTVRALEEQIAILRRRKERRMGKESESSSAPAQGNEPIHVEAEGNAPDSVPISVRIEDDIPISRASVARTAEDAAPAITEDGGFWDLGQPKKRIYEKPTFEGHTVGPVSVEQSPAADVPRGEAIPPRPPIPPHPPIPPRPADRTASPRVVQTVDGYRAVTTASYRRRVPRGSPPRATPAVPRSRGEVIRSYVPEGENSLIRRIEVRSWETDQEFYSRFSLDARTSHESPSAIPVFETPEPVPYLSYVPQYSHMNRRQGDYYRWVRENIRNGQYPPCDLPYLQLYIYEIINLPDVIVPEEGAELLSRIWTAYRGAHPRLDGLLCEWLPDYCMIHAVPLPREILSILPIIVPKAQFKEFYLSAAIRPETMGKTLIEVASDYDYRGSRYYGDNHDAYDIHIPAAVSAAVQSAMAGGRGMFAMDRIYQMTRDSYCGAIVSSGIKRRLDISFCSYTRRADTRLLVTAMVKYAENKLRATFGIKAKLSVGELSSEDTAAIDGYFAPLMPEKAKRGRENADLPPDYLKQYEAEDTGFDLSRAAEIERASWMNTTRLTGEAYGEDPAPMEEEEEIPELPWGAVTYTPDETNEESGTNDCSALPVTPEPHETPAPDDEIRGGLRAALEGNFSAYCRGAGCYEGDLADRINTVFLAEDVLGDVVLENRGDGFELIEDYREDVSLWLT